MSHRDVTITTSQQLGGVIKEGEVYQIEEMNFMQLESFLRRSGVIHDISHKVMIL